MKNLDETKSIVRRFKILDESKISVSNIESDYNIETIKTKHEKIAQMIVLLWGNKECVDYMSKLVADTNSDRYQRQGFSFDVLDSVMKLIDTHNKTFPQFAKVADNDLWTAFKRKI